MKFAKVLDIFALAVLLFSITGCNSIDDKLSGGTQKTETSVSNNFLDSVENSLILLLNMNDKSACAQNPIL